MISSVRVLTMSLLTTVTVGVVLTAVVIRLSLSGQSGTLDQIADLLLVSLMASLPITVPLGVVGGAIAVWGSKRSVAKPNPGWVMWGGLVGFAVGALGAGLAAIAFSTAKVVWAVYPFLGGAGGAVSGSLVGLWLGYSRGPKGVTRDPERRLDGKWRGGGS